MKLKFDEYKYVQLYRSYLINFIVRRKKKKLGTEAQIQIYFLCVKYLQGKIPL